MDGPLITSPANALIKRARALGKRRRRLEEGAFLVEGILPVWQAVEAGAAVEMLIVAPDLLRSIPARDMVERQRSEGLPVALVGNAAFESFAERQHPSGLAAIVQRRRRTLADLSVSSNAMFVAVHEAGNPGNLGAILRTVDAVGGTGLLAVGASTDPYHPTAVKASMGTLFTVPVVEVETLEEVLDWCRAQGVSVVTTSSHAHTPHWSVSYPFPCLLLFGSEGDGLPEEVLARGDLAVRIPMAGSAGSLNLAVAAGVLLYEVARPKILRSDAGHG